MTTEKGQSNDDVEGALNPAPKVSSATKWMLLIILAPIAMFFFLILLGLAGEVRKTWIQTDVVASGRAPTWDPDVLRAEWYQEIRGYQDEVGKAWRLEVAAQERIRAEWDNERRELLALREQLRWEKEEWTKERKATPDAPGKNLKEKEIPTWDELQPAPHCFGYGTREYTAQILKVPTGSDAMSTCNATTVEINGQKICHPQRCENRECNGVFGHWVVPDPKCETTHFSALQDKGCLKPGRYFEATLEGLQPGDNAIGMCMSTPAKNGWLHLDAPWNCWQKDLPLNSPVVANWWIYDPECDGEERI
ncbi:hypothetical protein FB45DRAFT_910575 [Roridomyces roridus]|uniref:Uncharacterized protein n=1 Tax=Roridomyces roridus TaxID=1738132 RepID=A0AAD7BZR1_9AGAR|nr:hypothetical protein FB45DRAFT_910575 [Roridomyces roridus]